jgi:hypothetical protein
VAGAKRSLHRLELARLEAALGVRLAAAAENRPDPAPHRQLVVLRALLVEQVHHVVLERVGALLVRQRFNGRRATQRRQKRPAVEFHGNLRRDSKTERLKGLKA